MISKIILNITYLINARLLQRTFYFDEYAIDELKYEFATWRTCSGYISVDNHEVNYCAIVKSY